METQYELEEPGLLSPVAVGIPGKRTFFLAIGEKDEWIRLWLEKEHLEAVSIAVDEFFTRLSEEFPQFSEDTVKPAPITDEPAGFPSGEFEIDQIGLGFDGEKAVMEFLVRRLGPQGADEIPVNCRITPGRVKRLGNRARDVCAAGRPRCEYCGEPIDPAGHDCSMQD